jgi:hypothetical protein
MTGKIIFFVAIGTLLQIFSVQDNGSNQQHIFIRIFSGVPISDKNVLRHTNSHKRCYFFKCQTAGSAFLSGINFIFTMPILFPIYTAETVI